MTIPLLLFGVLIGWCIQITGEPSKFFFVLGLMVFTYIISVNNHSHLARMAQSWIFSPYFLPLAIQASYPDGTPQEKTIALLWTLFYLVLIIYVFIKVWAHQDGVCPKLQESDPNGENSLKNDRNEVNRLENRLRCCSILSGALFLTGLILVDGLRSVLVGAGLSMAVYIYGNRHSMIWVGHFMLFVVICLMVKGSDFDRGALTFNVIWMLWGLATMLVAFRSHLLAKALIELRENHAESNPT